MIAVHKFGGSSLASLDRIKNAAKIVTGCKSEKKITVVSAMGGVTDRLLKLAENATAGNFAPGQLDQIVDQHMEILQSVGAGQSHLDGVQAESLELKNLLEASRVARSGEYAELISSFGELWSARIFQAILTEQGFDSEWLNARQFLMVRKGDMGVEIDWQKTSTLLAERLPNNPYVVITGYLASTLEDQPTTLGRNGTDWTASIVANLLSASSLTIWKDVDGVMSTDPKIVSEAFVLPKISYEEAAELAYFGAKVLHPMTIQPVREKSIPTFIRNSLDSKKPGTEINVFQNRDLSHPVKGFTVLKNISLLNIEGKGMAGVPGAAKRIFDALKEARISVTMISQSGSEQSICLAVSEDQAALAKSQLEQVFFSEIHHRLIDQIVLDKHCALIAAVGDSMVTQSGVAAKFCAALASTNVSIKAIAQGSSERNISVVINRDLCDRALKAAHASFYLSHTVINLGLIGPGQIGKELMEQLAAQKESLQTNLAIEFKMRSIANSQKMWVGIDDFQTSTFQENFDEKAKELDLSDFENSVRDASSPYSVFIDCTASETLTENYEKWLEGGNHIVTPNKKANSSSFQLYESIQRCAKNSHTHYYYESTVGAGLPVISTLQDLVNTGDHLISIRGILSGTLSYIFNNYDGTEPFSAVVSNAKALGYTEPDPRDDLSGMDVARKLVILGREAGLKIELEDIKIESLVPAELNQIPTADEFLTAFAAHDTKMKSRLESAQAQRKKLVYVATLNFTDQSAHVGLEEVDLESSIANTNGSDNILEFKTRRYDERPLVIKGPGAGPAVTAAGVFSDLLRLSQRLQRGY